MPLRALTLVLLAASAAGLAVAQADLLPTPFRPATEAETDISIVTVGPSSLTLAAVDRCDAATPRSALVTLSWQPVRAEGVTAQRVDITQFHEGFDVGRFETSGVLAVSDAAVTLAGPEPGIAYYWRVLTQNGTGWASSRVERFDVPVCPWDPPNTDNLLLQTPASSPADEGSGSSR